MIVGPIFETVLNDLQNANEQEEEYVDEYEPEF